MGAAATITTNWETFFDASTPVAKRATLLQDGSMFPTSVLAATGLAAHAKAQVLAVTNVTSTQAKVKYNILIGGTPALKNEMGIAVHQDGTWKVGVASFCSLLTLENGNKTAGLARTVQVRRVAWGLRRGETSRPGRRSSAP